MIKDEIKSISDLYFEYGFQNEEASDGYAVFSLIESIFPGVDILVEKDFEYDRIKSKYSEDGYSTNIVVFESIEILDLNLYKRVLNPTIAKRNLLSKYQKYVNKIIEPYKREDGTYPEYQYVEVGYQWEQDLKKQTVTEPLIDTLQKLIDTKEARFIIVEAPAGFGKTSTSFELLKRLCDQKNDNRPFMMELERERQASTFRYLLLSQIDRQFGANRKADLIIENIKNGRIPLIIDGFDELLSKDLDSGKEKISFKSVETMLSTIANLLDRNAKVVLTTRKTAIFSGDQFVDWIEYQNNKNLRNFKIDRFQLMESNPTDWLGAEKLSSLPSALSKISNPTLLSYLKYSDDLYDGQSVNPAELVEQYLKTLYIREKDRQDIKVKAASQEKIMRDVAAYFCIFDITADIRSNVKSFIYESNKSIIDEFTEDEEDRQELLNKLVNHALLDRHTSGLIRFVNDFVYGTLLYRAILNESTILDDLETMTSSNVDKVIESSEILSRDDKTLVAESLKKYPGITEEMSFRIDHRLLSAINGNYSSLYLNELSFSNIDFRNSVIRNTTFVQCQFPDSRINLENFMNCVFISCDFTKAECSGENKSNDFYQCLGVKFSISAQFESTESECQEQDLDILILKLFKRAGSENTRIRNISWIISQLESAHGRKKIIKHLTKLDSKGYIYTNGDHAWVLQAGSEYLKNNGNV